MPNYVFFNLATSGFSSSYNDTILQIGAVDSYNPRKKFNGYVEPGRRIHKKATEKHGYTTDSSCTKLINKHGNYFRI